MAKNPQPRPALLEIKPYVPGKPVEEVERELGLTNVLKLASNENPLGPSPLALQALREGLGKVSLYPDGSCYHLRRVLAEKLQVQEENLIIGNGSDEIIKLLAEAFLQPGEIAVMADPTFSEYEFAVQLMGGRCLKVPLKDFRHDLPAMLDAAKEGTRLFFVCNPNNPTGTIVFRRQVEEILEQMPPGVLVVLDEAYQEYVADKEYPDSLKYVREGLDNLIVLRTFSKIYGLAGLRVGYGVAAPEIIQSVMKAREPFNVNLLGQIAARAALGDHGHLWLSRKVNAEGKTFLYEELSSLGLSYVPTEANFILLDVGVDCREFFQRMLKRGVIVRTGDIFGLPTWIRVTIGTEKQNQRFLENLAEVRAEMI